MTTSAESAPAARSLFQAAGGGSTPTSALQLTLDTMDFADAIRLNRAWHSRLSELGVGCVKTQPYLCFGAEFDGRVYAVAIWSNPVARSLPQSEWLELRRLAISGDAPRNTASRMLGVMARLVRRLRPHVVRLISYQDTEVHTGAIYRAAGWVPVVVTAGGEWDTPTRPRPKSQSAAKKVRWEKSLC